MSMYQTMISRVNGRVCFDSTGRQLVRIGNMNVNAGDAVWTDGRVIYGNEYPGAEVPILFEGSFEGIPLNAIWHESLFIYKHDHGIERFSAAKDELPFANNDARYCLGSSWGEISDMDIGKDGRPWTISTHGAGYWVKTPIEFYALYRGQEENASFKRLADYFFAWDVYTYKYHIYEKTTHTSAAHPENNTDSETHTDKSRKWNDANTGVTPIMRNSRLLTSDTPVLVKHGEETVATVGLGQYAEAAKSCWMGLMGQFGGSGKWQDTIETCSCYVWDARIDEKGNYSLVVYATVSGYCFKDIPISILSVSRTKKKETIDFAPNEATLQGQTYRWDTKRIETVTDETVVGTETSIRTIPGTLSCEVRYLVDKDGMREIYRSYYYNSPLRYGTLETHANGTSGTLNNNEKNFGQDYPPEFNTFSVWEGSASLVGFGMFMGGYTSRETPPVTYPPKTKTPYTISEAMSNEQEYEMPIQDGYVCKNSDYTEVYKDGRQIASVDFEIGGIVALDRKGKEYLLLGRTDGVVALYRNGSVSYPKAPVFEGGDEYEIYTTNMRLRWMRTLSRLRG